MATSFKIKRKLYTQWDDTDNLKKMKDSDILAEKKRNTGPTIGGVTSVASNTVAGVAAGGVLGATLGGTKGLLKPKANLGRLSSAGRGISKFGKLGMVAGGALAATKALNSESKRQNDNRFYNQRLEYAQRQALRREKKDWKTNMTQRDGYTY